MKRLSILSILYLLFLISLSYGEEIVELECIGSGEEQINDEDVFELNYTESASYNRQSAINYAKQWCGSNRNPKYCDFSNSGGDCANFVSQILIAGGMNLADPNTGLYSCNGQKTYINVDTLHNYLIKHASVLWDDRSEVVAGDVMILTNKYKERYHAQFIRGTSGSGPSKMVYVDSHTTDRCNDAYPMDMAYAYYYHILDDAKIPTATVEFTDYPQTVVRGKNFNVSVHYSTNFYEFNMRGKVVLDIKVLETGEVLQNLVYDNNGVGLQGPAGDYTFTANVTTQATQIYFVTYFTTLYGDYNSRLSLDSTKDDPTTVSDSDTPTTPCGTIEYNYNFLPFLLFIPIIFRLVIKKI